MSYLHLPSLGMGDLSKGTISLWFRFSDDTVTKAAPYQSTRMHPNAPGVLDSTMPLVTFGRDVTAHVYSTVSRTWTQTIPGGTISHVDRQVSNVGEAPCGPSHIGIVCGETSNLVMCFQMDTRAAVQGLLSQTADVHWEPVGTNYQMYTVVEDVSYVRVGQPESFLINPDFAVDVDEWHHLLVSFDFTSSVDVVGNESNPVSDDELRSSTIKSYCKLWYAFDDENKNGKDNIGWIPGVGQPPLGWVPQDENGIIPRNAENAIVTYTTVPPDPFVSGALSNPEYHWSASGLPVSGGAMGLPASEQYVETVYHCELAEFQMWPDVTVDTGDVNVRRVFIDFENPADAGKPGKHLMKPVDPKKAAELLGKPAILLHGSNNWKNGYNTGSLGITDDPEGQMDNPSGQFQPVGKIVKYLPDPALEAENAGL